MKPVQILYVNPTGQLGGAEYSLLDLAASLDRTRFVPVLACLGRRSARRRRVGTRHHVVPLQLPAPVCRLSLKGERSGPAASPPRRSRRHRSPGSCERSLQAARSSIPTATRRTFCRDCVAGARGCLARAGFLARGAVERGMVRFANRQAVRSSPTPRPSTAHLVGMGVAETLVHAVPNGIDSTRFAPKGRGAAARGVWLVAPSAPLVGVVGHAGAVEGTGRAAPCVRRCAANDDRTRAASSPATRFT